jgi:transposase
VILFSDATILTETPPLRASWSLLGDPAQVPISGNRRKAALFGTINIGTGHCCIEAVDRWNGLTWRDHLRRIRHGWRGWNIVLLLDRGSPHTAQASRDLAADLGIELRWLPIACPELNPVESIWRWLKGTVLCNSQPRDFTDTIRTAVNAIHELRPRQLLIKAGILSQNFWLRT